MATLPKEVRDKLRKLVPMLSSDQPGEVANAASLITKILKVHKRDWHDLNDILTGDPERVVEREPAQTPTHAFEVYARAGGSYEIPEPELSGLLDRIRQRRTFVTDWEQGFLSDFEDRCLKYAGSMIFVSSKQLNIFTRIMERVPL